MQIIAPRTNQERQFAFKPSSPDRKIGLGCLLTEIDDDGFYPEMRNIAAVAVARTLGLIGENGVMGDAFMGVVDGKLGILMQVAPGWKPQNC